MKGSKQETTLCEKDALQDLLDCEKLLMNYYAAAFTEGSCKAFRKEILKHYTSNAETQFSVYEQMLARDYYEVQPAAKLMIDKNADTFGKVKKQIS